MEETGFLLRSIMCGAVLSVGYDLMRWIVDGLFRRRWWRGLEDLLYWTVCAIVLFAMIREENGGVLRWYALVGAAAGAGTYGLGIRPVIHRILKIMWIPIRKTIQFVENLLKKRKKSVTLIGKIENGALRAERGRGHGRIR